MWKAAAQKLIAHFAACLAAWLLLRRFAPQGELWAGWALGVLGACYLLAGWLAFLKTRGTDVASRLRRTHTETPYALRGPEKQRRTALSLNGNRHVFDDDLDDCAAHSDDALPLPARSLARAIAWGALGVILLLWSMW